MKSTTKNLACLLACCAVTSAISIAGDNPENAWELGNPLLTPGPKGSFDEISVKDPSVVFHEGKWHVFYTARSKEKYTTGYVAANELSKLQLAQRHELAVVTHYGCAPQVFYFEPQRKWYLIFQTKDSNYQPVFSTTSTIAAPDTWSPPGPLLPKDTRAKWIDFWVICDKTKAYLFYTEQHNRVMVRSTKLGEFPGGWSKSKKVFEGIHEAVHVYKPKDSDGYHMFYELNRDGLRSFGLASATHLEGPWQKVTANYATGHQLRTAGGIKRWTDMVSHGEVIRSGYNELLEYDPKTCRWLIQGTVKDDKGSYDLLPWKLGVIGKLKSSGTQAGPTDAGHPAQ